MTYSLIHSHILPTTGRVRRLASRRFTSLFMESRVTAVVAVALWAAWKVMATAYELSRFPRRPGLLNSISGNFTLGGHLFKITCVHKKV